MNNANDAGHVTPEEIEYIEQRAVRSPDLDLTFSQVFNPLQIPNPDAEVGKYTVASETGEAQIIRQGSRANKLKINGTQVTYTLDSIEIEYEIPKADIRLARSFGSPLNVEYVDRSVRKVNEKLNALAYVGDTQFGDFQGILEVTGVTTYVGTDLDTSGLNLFNEVQNAVNAIPQEFRRRPYFLVVADKEWKKFAAIGNDFNNQSWLSIIESNIPNLTVVLEDELVAGADLAGGGTIATGTAMLIPNDVSLVRFPVARPVTSVVDRNSQGNDYEKSLFGRVEARYGPIEVPFPKSVVKITGWDA